MLLFETLPLDQLLNRTALYGLMLATMPFFQAARALLTDFNRVEEQKHQHKQQEHSAPLQNRRYLYCVVWWKLVK